MRLTQFRRFFAVMVLAVVLVMTGCGTGNKAGGDDQKDSGKDAANSTQIADLSGKSLMIYCGAGMKDPVTKIVNAFKEETSCEVDVTFCNGAQANSQITTTEQGDLFIAGAVTEIENLKEKNFVTATKDLVQHIPVIAVPTGNPKDISSINDLGSSRLILGDADATPIGKIANAVLKDAQLMEKANIIARTATAPEMITALSTAEADAAIVWKENAEGKDGIEVLNVEGMDKYIKTIPAASLSCAANGDSLEAFLKFLDTEKAHNIWTEAGYVVI